MDNNINNSSNAASNSSSTFSVFIDHVKQLLATIPPVTKFALYTPILLCVLDRIVFPLLSVHFRISSWICLDFNQSVMQFQVFRFLTYPFSTANFVQLFITDLWLAPELYKLERKQGSLRFLWILMTVFTILPGISYVIIMKSITLDWASDFYGRGMSGWVVGLIFWSYLQDDEDDQQDRMIAGAIRMPRKMWPVVVFVFFIFLVQDASVFLNISSAITGYLYAKEKLNFLVPSNEKFIEYEAKPWLRLLTGANNFVSTETAGQGGYIPIFMPSSAPTLASTINTTSTSNTRSNNTTNGSFPGQGHRLGDA